MRRVRMNYIVNSLAAYEVHVARYYYRRGAYVAAANRAQTGGAGVPAVAVGAKRRSTSWSQSYDRLGLTELRDDADRVLRKNFPNTHASAPTASAGKKRLVAALVIVGQKRQRRSAASVASQSSASASVGDRVIGGSASRRRLP